MLTETEYNKLKEYREAIFAFKENNKYNAGGFEVFNEIRQRHNRPPMCFTCNASKIEALSDMYHFIIEYEQWEESQQS